MKPHPRLQLKIVNQQSYISPTYSVLSVVIPVRKKSGTICYANCNTDLLPKEDVTFTVWRYPATRPPLPLLRALVS